MQYTSYYKGIARKFDAIRSDIIDSSSEKVDLLIKEGNILRNSKIVEIGSGTGNHILRVVKKMGCDGTGIDISKEMLSVSVKKNSKDAKYINADAKKMPIKSAHYDLAYAVNSIHQMGDLNEVFTEVFRVLKPGGKFIVLTPDLERLKYFMLYAACSFLYEFEKRRLPDKSYLTQCSLKAGFTVFKNILPPIQKNPTSLEQFLYFIRNRFLSCLSNLSHLEISKVIENVEKYATERKEFEIFPYYYLFICFVKGG